MAQHRQGRLRDIRPELPAVQEPARLSDPEFRQRLQTTESSVGVNSSPQQEVANSTHAANTLQCTVTQEWQVIANKDRDWGKNRIPEVTGTQFAAIISCYSEILGRHSGNAAFQQPETVEATAQAAHLLRQCKNTTASIKVWRPTRVPSLGIATAFPARDIADAMVRLYFQAFESTHRILHGPSFWVEYETFWRSPDTLPSDLRLKVLLVISLGSSLGDHDQDAEATLRNNELAHQWIYEAEQWLAGPLEKDRLSISGVQVRCLTILARQIFSIGGDTIWVTMGSLIHTAMQLGLHHDPKHLPDLPCLQAEVRRRLWATILDLTVQAALDAGMPPRISLDEFDTRPPANVNDDEMLETATSLKPHPEDVLTSASVQIALLESLPLRLRIAKHLSSRSEALYSDVLELNSQLVSAVRKIHARLPGAAGANLFHKNMLDYHVRRFIIPLNYPFSNRARQNPLYDYSLKLSAETAVAIMNPEGDHTSPIPGFSRLMIIGGGMFREGFRSAMTALALELLGLVQDQRLDGTLTRNAPQRELLKGQIRQLVDFSIERIKLGETNVKSHMFLEMILAQVEAIEIDEPAEPKIAKAARDSLGICHGLLLERAAHQTGPARPDEAVELEPDLGSVDFGFDWDWDCRTSLFAN